MTLFRIFDIAGSAMSAQSVRLNTTASNLANAGSTAGKPEDVYRARQPVFQTFMAEQPGAGADPLAAEAAAGVRVVDVVESNAPPARVYQPGHPEADAEGYVYTTNVNVVDEMVNMISASRTYQNSIEVLNTSKDLLLRTLTLGQ
jgi:flagellar basal-body rod protein FlgC